MSRFKIATVACLKDNYAYLASGEGFCAVIDPAEAGPVEAALKIHGLTLSHILNTHHHFDHTGGNLVLKRAYGAKVVGPANESERIPGIDIDAREAEGLVLGGSKIGVLEVPGHTKGASAFLFDDAVFTGDTLFAMGCGRLFEGTAATMFASLAKLAALPDDTAVYCGHEYTETNGRFALTLEPNNADLRARMREVEALRAANKPTVPSSIGLEKRTNPFLRTASPEIRATLKMADADEVAVFAEIRRRKDAF